MSNLISSSFHVCIYIYEYVVLVYKLYYCTTYQYNNRGPIHNIYKNGKLVINYVCICDL